MDGSTVSDEELEPVEFVTQGNVTAEQICANIAANAGRALPTVEFGKICICASGPSLVDHIDQIRERQRQGWRVAAMNGSYKFLVEHGIRVDLFFMVDARPEINLPFVTGDHVTLSTRHVIASQCHPEIFEALDEQRLLLWQIVAYPGAIDAVKAALGSKRPGALFMGNLNVGISCLNAISAMGYNDWALFGFDGSLRRYDPDGPAPGAADAQGIQRHAFHQPQNASEPVQCFQFPCGPNGERLPQTVDYWATPTMAHGATVMPERISHFRQHGVRIEIVGDGLLPAMVAHNAIANTGTIQGDSIEEIAPKIPAPNPRRAQVERLPIVTFKWQGHIPYTVEDVRIWANQVSRFARQPHELVCVTDDMEILAGKFDQPLRTIPMWRDHFEHGRDWHRLKLFAEEMADIIGPRFVVMDLDTVICGQLDPLFEDDAPFKAWRDPIRDQYCTSLFMMDAGAFPHVWDWFDPVAAMRLRTNGMYGGYDQAWISHVLPGQPRWTRDDGVLSFRKDLLGGMPLPDASKLGDWHMRRLAPPPGARIINFHGKHKPRDADVQAAFPWIADFYR